MNSSVAGDVTTSFFLVDRKTAETLASFSEASPNRPLVSRNLHLPNDHTGCEVASIMLDKATGQVNGIMLSPGYPFLADGRRGEVIYDQNLDGILDVLHGHGRTPHPKLLRISATEWVPSDVRDGQIGAVLNGQWVPLALEENDFWKAVEPRR